MGDSIWTQNLGLVEDVQREYKESKDLLVYHCLIMYIVYMAVIVENLI